MVDARSLLIAGFMRGSAGSRLLVLGTVPNRWYHDFPTFMGLHIE